MHWIYSKFYKLLSNPKLIYLIYKENISIYKKILNNLYEFIIHLDDNKKIKENIIDVSNLILKLNIDNYSIIFEGEDIQIPQKNKNMIFKLILNCFNSFKNIFLTLMNEKEILINQLNFNLSPEQFMIRDFVEYN